MKNYLKDIESKLKKNIQIDEIKIVDNSHKHKGHRFFSPDKLHIHLKIKSSFLNSIKRLDAQKLIMKVLKEDLESKIHALEISLEK
tara:strand:- start:669 stop:926 length:258 start_codon:yes stop_codon:yes gene_type:complete